MKKQFVDSIVVDEGSPISSSGAPVVVSSSRSSSSDNLSLDSTNDGDYSNSNSLFLEDYDDRYENLNVDDHLVEVETGQFRFNFSTPASASSSSNNRRNVIKYKI